MVGLVAKEIVMHKRVAILTSMILACAGLAAAQEDKSQRPSPPASAECKLPDGKTIKTDYSSPRLRGRKMIGGNNPYGQVWRLGANDATTFVTDTNLTVGGKDVPAGSYTLFAIPNADKWTLIISKKTGEWGTQYPGPGEDLARVDMKVSQLPSKLENFTISYEPSSGGCTMNADWDTTRASVEISPKK
jgi:Protein of unknown function (DUF2911)